MHPDEPLRVFSHVTIADLTGISESVLALTSECKIWVLSGEMGAGKTTIVKSIGRALKAEDTMSSPTFSIVNEYRLPDGTLLYHFDFYRIRSELEAADIGTEEYFYSGNLCFIEWPEKIPNLLPDFYGEIKISIEDNSHRTIALLFHGRKEEKRI
jgi:tRNA threonylcarbamoyladenosine biosynthesis protein TsaE